MPRATKTPTTPEPETTQPEPTTTPEQPEQPEQTPLSPAMAKILAKAQQIAAAHPSPKRTKAPRECACGCGGMTKGGTWIPGHDAKALSRMLAEIRTGKAAA